MDQDYYEILGVSANATTAEIQRAYRTLARKFHPDLCEPEEVDLARERFKVVQTAYEILSDPDQRERFDPLDLDDLDDLADAPESADAAQPTRPANPSAPTADSTSARRPESNGHVQQPYSPVYPTPARTPIHAPVAPPRPVSRPYVPSSYSSSSKSDNRVVIIATCTGLGALALILVVGAILSNSEAISGMFTPADAPEVTETESVVTVDPPSDDVMEFTEGSHVELNASSQLVNFNQPFTIEMLVQFADDDSCWLFGNSSVPARQDETSPGMFRGWQVQRLKDVIAIGSINLIGAKIRPMPEDRWHHIALCGDGEALWIHVDGILSEPRDVRSFEWTASAQNIFLGSSPRIPADGQRQFRGKIAALRISSTCRIELVAADHFILEKDTVALLDFFRTRDNIIPDRSEYEHFGIIHEAPPTPED